MGQNQSYSLVAGNSWNRLGAIVSVTWSENHQNQREDRTFHAVSGGDLEVQKRLRLRHHHLEDLDRRRREPRLQVFREPPGGPRELLHPQLENEARIFEGYNNDVGEDIRNTRLLWVEEDIFSSQLSGEHLFPALGSARLDWNANLSRASRNEPDLRETLYEYSPSISSFVLADESQSGFRMFNDLDDEVVEFGLDWSSFFTQWDGLPAMLKIGPQLTMRERDFGSRRFRLKPRGAGFVDLTLPPERIFTPENIGSAYELREETRPTDTYAADQTVSALYGMVDLPLGSRLRVIGGARVERSRQQVDTFDPFSTTAETVTAALENTDVLPGVSAVFALSPAANLRAGYSHTVNRPEFRELAPFEFTDVVGGRAVVGNPNLERALIRNLDFRVETFPAPAEVLAVSLFHKHFRDPIERIVQPTAQLRTSYANALGAGTPASSWRRAGASAG